MARLYNSASSRGAGSNPQALAGRTSACFLLMFVMANCSLCAEAHGHLHAPSFPAMQELEAIPLSTWCMALVGALIVGSTGVLPLLFIPSNSSFKNGLDPRKLNVLLSFAVGGLLGDVFLHLLPETRAQMYTLSMSAGHEVDNKIGLLVIAGMVAFLVAEKVMVVYSGDGAADVEEAEAETVTVTTTEARDDDSSLRRRPIHGKTNGVTTSSPVATAESAEKISPAGYLNLFANIIDNFAHGLAVAASFLAGERIGMLTTFAIIVHEVPHELGDFAILLNSGFSRWSAAKAQMVTASGALVGAMFGLLLRNAGESVLWILPFTGGGFLYIALVSVMPTLLSETRPAQSALQVLAMVCGVAVMCGMDLGGGGH